MVLKYDGVESVKERNSVFGDISEYTITKMNDGLMQYAFFDANADLVLNILAESVRVFEVGESTDINSALFDVGYEYIGDQRLEL